MDDKYIEYVKNIVEQYKKAVTLLAPGETNLYPSDVNRVLADYGRILFTLVAEYQRVVRDYERKKLLYENWWNSVMVEFRREMKSKSRYTAIKEIEIEAKDRHMEEYTAWQNTLIDAESKKDFYKSLIDAWKSMESILITLSSNMRAEMRILGLEKSLQPPPGVSVGPVSTEKLGEDSTINGG